MENFTDFCIFTDKGLNLASDKSLPQIDTEECPNKEFKQDIFTPSNKVDDRREFESSTFSLDEIFRKCQSVDPESFISYLDNNFRPEIILCEPKSPFINVEEGVKRKKNEGLMSLPLNSPNPMIDDEFRITPIIETMNKEEDSATPSEHNKSVYLFYRGQKHSLAKGMFSERRDVIFKTLIRAVRRYLWELFAQEEGLNPRITKMKKNEFKSRTQGFYNRLFKAQFGAFSESKNNELASILAIFMTSYLKFPKKSEEERRLTNTLKQMCKNFSIASYTQLFMNKSVREFFSLLSISGTINKIIALYPKMSDSSELYLRAVDRIINFDQNPVLE